jgi:flavin-dependent dehydrogenase
VWINDGHRLPREASGLLGMCVSRPLLEGYVRERVSQLPNVEIRHRTEALGLLANPDRSRVVGARVLPRGEEPQEIPAELVVDATGRGNRGPTWLTQLGYDRPAEEHVDPVTVYMSRDYRRVEGDADFRAIVQSPWPGNPYGGVAIAADGDRWMVTLLGCGRDNFPPSDPDGFLGFAKRLPSPALHDLLSKAEPLGPPMKLRLPASVRRRYEHLERLPEGLIAFGDAICAFNPAYGQGMTAAAAEALELRACLAKGRNGLPKRFYARAARVIDVPWDIAVGADLRYEHVAGPRSRKVNFLNSYIGRVHAAASRHAAVAKAFLSVANLMAAPQALFKPGVLARVLLSGRRTPDIPAPVSRPRALEPVA